jgi:hypothetical protein
MTRLALPAAVLLAAVAAWLSQATLAVATPDGPRIALLPVSTLSLVLSALCGAAVVGVARAGLPLAPLWLLALIIVPWLPVPLPPALVMWSGSIGRLLWAAVLLLILAPAAARVQRTIALTPLGALCETRPQLCAGLVAFSIFLVSAWQVAPSIPGGDEPHYLVISQSLLLDGDLKIENNHRRGDYHSYYAGALPPHYIQRGRDGEIYSIHAPGLAALVAPAFALAGYHGVVLFLVVLSACGSALAWHLAYLATGSAPGAWFGWAAVTLSATAIFHSFTVYPDGVGGVIALTGLWALLRADQERATGGVGLRPWFLHGAALALLPWMHSRFALLAGSFGALILLRLAATKNPAGKAVALLSVPAVSALCWVGFFLVIYGRPDPSAPYGTSRDFSLTFVPGGLAGLLFDQRFGLIANAPVLIFGAVGLAMMFRLRQSATPVRGGSPQADSRLAVEILFVIVPYLITATSYAMWWAGWSAPARFANPAVFLLAIPCAVAWAGLRHRATRTVAAGSLALTAFLSLVLVTTDGGRLAYNTRETTALWLEWASSLAALGDGLPVWYRGLEGVFARDVIVWAAVLLSTMMAARALSGRPWLREPVRYATAVAGLFAAAAMCAITIVWALKGIDGLAPARAQLDVLRRQARDPHVRAVQLTPPRRLDSSQLFGLLRLESAPLPGGGRGRSAQPLVSLPGIPAGRYRITVRTRGPGGWLIVGVGQDQFALRSEPLAHPPVPVEIDVPVDLRALVIRGDEDARRTVRTVVVEPLALLPVDARVTDRVARRAVAYQGASVFFFDDACFPEPEAFWVGGSRQATFAVQPSGPSRSVTLFVRNAPVENQVTFESGQWREDLTLAPGEERPVTIPLAPGRAAAIVTATTRSGFRPSQTIPDSRDDRYLGVWVRPERP